MDPNPDANTNQDQGEGQDRPLGPSQEPLASPSVVPPSPVVMGASGPAPRKSKKKLILLSVGIVLLLGLAGGGVFGYYLPNKPENVWRTSLNRTGEALSKATNSVTEKSKLDALSKSNIKATAETGGTGYGYSGAFNMTFDKNKADGSLDITVKQQGTDDQTFGAKFLSELKEGSTYPSLYLQLYGMKALGLENFEQVYPGISEYDGKWIALEEEYLRSIAEQALHPDQAQQAPQEQKKADPITADNFAQFARMASDTVKEYVFTAQPDKAVFEQRSFVGKETVNGMKAYHYKVGIHKQHAKDFCKAFTERMWTTDLYLKATGYASEDQATRDTQRDDAVKRCQESTDNKKEDRTFDLWVDSKYKLIHKIRVTDEKDSSIYTELGQNYKGGDDVALFVNFHNGKEQIDGSVTLDSNLKTSETKSKMTMKSAKKDDPFNITASIEAKPFKEEIKVEKPDGAVPIKDIFDRYGIDPVGLLGLQGMATGDALTQEFLTAPAYLN